MSLDPSSDTVVKTDQSSINQSTNQSINQTNDSKSTNSNNKSINQSTNQTNNETINNTSNQSTSRSTSHSFNQPASHSTSQSSTQSTNQSINQSTPVVSVRKPLPPQVNVSPSLIQARELMRQSSLGSMSGFVASSPRTPAQILSPQMRPSINQSINQSITPMSPRTPVLGASRLNQVSKSVSIGGTLALNRSSLIGRTASKPRTVQVLDMVEAASIADVKSRAREFAEEKKRQAAEARHAEHEAKEKQKKEAAAEREKERALAKQQKEDKARERETKRKAKAEEDERKLKAKAEAAAARVDNEQQAESASESTSTEAVADDAATMAMGPDIVPDEKPVLVSPVTDEPVDDTKHQLDLKSELVSPVVDEHVVDTKNISKPASEPVQKDDEHISPAANNEQVQEKPKRRMSKPVIDPVHVVVPKHVQPMTDSEQLVDFRSNRSKRKSSYAEGSIDNQPRKFLSLESLSDNKRAKPEPKTPDTTKRQVQTAPKANSQSINQSIHQSVNQPIIHSQPLHPSADAGSVTSTSSQRSLSPDTHDNQPTDSGESEIPAFLMDFAEDDQSINQSTASSTHVATSSLADALSAALANQQ